MTSGYDDRLQALLDLSHDLGRPERQLAILGEGNTSCRVDEETFLVKASGSSLPTLETAGVTQCRLAPLLALMEQEGLEDAAVTQALLDSRVEMDAKKPSVEASFHAYLLTLDNVNFVAHTHPISVNGILCSPVAEAFARHRLFPDEIVCCGAASVLVPYVDPGVPLARAIREGVEGYRQEHSEVPRVILLQNHGLITLGATAAGALAATLMCDKAARIFSAAAMLGGVVPLSPENVARIEGRDDEAYRRQALKL